METKTMKTSCLKYCYYGEGGVISLGGEIPDEHKVETGL